MNMVDLLIFMKNMNLFIIFILMIIKKNQKNMIFQKADKIKIINIIIGYKVKSFKKIFLGCKCIEKISFINFRRKDIKDMSFMFYKCSSLKELNLSNFVTNNVTNMYLMFYDCFSLKELNLSNFITDKVNNMNYMFYCRH